MSLTVYAYRNCDTCRKALAYLRDRGLAVTSEVDVTVTPPPRPLLAAMAARLGVPVRKLFNTSGQVYREMGLGARLPALSDEEALDLLAGNGRLVKRPFLVVDGEPRAIGFRPAEWDAVFAGR